MRPHTRLLCLVPSYKSGPTLPPGEDTQSVLPSSSSSSSPSPSPSHPPTETKIIHSSQRRNWYHYLIPICYRPWLINLSAISTKFKNNKIILSPTMSAMMDVINDYSLTSLQSHVFTQHINHLTPGQFHRLEPNLCMPHKASRIRALPLHRSLATSHPA